MFDAPGFNVDTLLQTDEEGKGVVTILDLTDMQERPGLFASAMMWLLYEVYRRSPEVGDVVKPRLVFFFDEAHLLFKDASKGLVDTVERTVRMSRSKGLGVFFVTQTASDMPEEILGQLGNRVQHALRAFTPKDAKAVRETVKTFPHSAAYDVHHAIQGMSTGQAIISVLTADGSPGDTVVAKVNLPKALQAEEAKTA